VHTQYYEFPFLVKDETKRDEAFAGWKRIIDRLKAAGQYEAAAIHIAKRKECMEAVNEMLTY
jgi:hypothetical protein